ncbi:MAG: ABC transporter substrate-binding protein, partial [Burkholderiales bacterium]|nr:ABC transporter substrate-binding protein [Burkholderiales bacterium]
MSKIDKTDVKYHPAYNPDRPLLVGCSCGGNHAPDEHDAAMGQPSVESMTNDFLEAALVKAIFPHEPTRRAFLRSVGKSTAMAAIASVVPMASMQALAQENHGPIEKKNLKVGFIAITCAAPLIMAETMGCYRDQGLQVQLVKTSGWADVRDKIIKKEHDASHFLSPMPLAMSMGLGNEPFATSVSAMQNSNGQAITLSLKHRALRDPKQWRGMTFAVPFVYSMHNFLLRYYVAEHGLDPDRDIKIVAVPPPQMVEKLRDGAIDGFLGPDPYNQRAVYDQVGFIHTLSKEIWDGHPCCAFGASDEFIQKNPNTFAALFRAFIAASLVASIPSERNSIAKMIAPAPYLNQPIEVITQILTGKFPDGLGNNLSVPDRTIYYPVPWQSMAVWMLTQMKRWGYVKGDVNYAQIAEKV